MAYTKTVWKDQKVENPRTYSMRQNLDNTVTLLDAFGEVKEIGTAVNAENMNKIESGIETLDTTCAKLAENNTFTGKNFFTAAVTLLGASPLMVLKNDKDDWKEDTGVLRRFGRISFYDKNNLEVFQILPTIDSKNRRLVECAFRDAEGNAKYAFRIFPTGIITLTPASNASGQEVTTAEWVRNLFPLKDLNNATTAGVGIGYVYIGDLLIQWGQIPAGINSPTTLHKPYANKDYTVLVAYSTEGAISSAYGHCNAVAGTETEFKWNREINVPLSWVSFGVKGA